MQSIDVTKLYTELEAIGIRIWIDGGWCVDALLGKQLRAHDDLDIAIEYDDVPKLREYLEARGYKEIKCESEWNFELADEQDKKVDVHAFVTDENRKVIDGIKYPDDSLTGTGMIDGQSVRCISPEWTVKFLTPLISQCPDKYIAAVGALCEKFGIALPVEYSKIK